MTPLAAPSGRKLLPPGALAGCAIALSVSDSEDLSVLGLSPMHLKLALAEIARVVFVSNGRLLYAGDLRPDGHTELLLQELARYGQGQGALELYMAWSTHRRTLLSSLEDADERLGIRGRLIALDREGQPLAHFRDGRSEAGSDDLPPEAREAAYDAMRERVRGQEFARLAIGGRRRRDDVMPGVLQEVLQSLDAKHPVYLAGGFGGITSNIAAALAGDPSALCAPMAGALGARATLALDQLARHAAATGGWSLLNNELSDDENRRLAATHRPSEIAALLATGLGRCIQREPERTPDS